MRECKQCDVCSMFLLTKFWMLLSLGPHFYKKPLRKPESLYSNSNKSEFFTGQFDILTKTDYKTLTIQWRCTSLLLTFYKLLLTLVTEAIHYGQTLSKIIKKIGHVFIILMIPFEGFKFLKWTKEKKKFFHIFWKFWS